MTRKNYWILVGAIILAGLALRFGLQHSMQSHFADDAYIFMRYVQNFSNGHGLVYNVGSHVMGFTSPLFVLLVCGLHTVLRSLPLEATISALNMFLFLVLIVTCTAMRVRFANSLALPLLLVFYYPYLDASLNGMETMLFVTCIFSCVLCLTRDRINLGLIAAALAALTRPEGVLCLGIVAALLVWVRPTVFPWKGIGVSVLLAGLWAAFSVSYYGTMLPQSMLAKATAHTASAIQPAAGPLDTYLCLAAGLSTASLSKLPDAVHGILSVLAVVSMPLMIIALLSFIQKKDYWAVFPAFFLSVWVFYCVGKPIVIWSWYAIPTSMAFAAGLLPWALQYVPFASRSGRRIGLEAAIALFCAGSIMFGLPGRIQGQVGMTARLFSEADYLKRTIPAAKSVMVGDIGVLGYKSGLKIVDMAGLVSPEVFRKGADGQKITFGTEVENSQPDVLMLREDPRDIGYTVDGSLYAISFADEDEKNQFDNTYMLVDVDYEFFHPFIFVKRSMVNNAMFRAEAMPQKGSA